MSIRPETIDKRRAVMSWFRKEADKTVKKNGASPTLIGMAVFGMDKGRASAGVNGLLKGMVKEGILVRLGSGPKTTYRPAPKVRPSSQVIPADNP